MDSRKSEVIKIPYLDGLRGVAALMVFMAHLMISLFPAVVTFSKESTHTSFDIPLGLSPISFIWCGHFAVCIFFVLSGFVLSDFCQVTKISFPAQIVRRYFRLACPMLLTSCFAWLLLHFGLYNNVKASIITHSGWLSMWYQFHPHFLSMIKEATYSAFIQGYANYNCNLWTMKIELIGSIYIFLLHALFKNRFMRLFVIAWFFQQNYHNLNNYYLLFAMGAFLFDFHRDIKISVYRLLASQRLYTAAVIIGFFIGLYLGAFPDTQASTPSWWYTWFTKSKNAQGWHMLGAVILMLFLTQWRDMQHLLSNRTGKFLGKISFVLYLTHIPVLCSVTSWIICVTKGLPYILTAIISSIATFIVVISLSMLVYRYVDLYTTSFSRWIGKAFDQWLHKQSQPNTVSKGALECS